MADTVYSGKVPSFGESIRSDFYFRHGSTFVNHGSYGAVPRPVKEAHIRLQKEMESHPDDWFRRKVEIKLSETRRVVADFLKTQPEDTFLVQNATTGVNTVLKSCPLGAGDVVLITNLTYGSVIETVRHVVSRVPGAEVVTLEVEFPLQSENDLIELYEAVFRKHPNIKLAIVDHITSSSALLLPVKKITEVCHEHGAIVLVDGAHAPGQIPLCLPDIDADFYTGNFHKWLFTPRTCAVLWRNPVRPHSWLSPLVTTVYLGQGLEAGFGYEGTKDNTAYLCTVDGINYMNSLGGMERVTSYNSKLRQEAAEYLVNNWSTNALPVPVSMVAPCMQLVKLPPISGYSLSQEGAEKMFSDIYYRHDIQTAVTYIQGELYVRLSVQVYNTFNDFQRLNDVIKDMLHVHIEEI